MATTNNTTDYEIHNLAALIYFGTNQDAINEWKEVQDYYFKKNGLYKLPSLYGGSWHSIPISEQSEALQKGNAIVKKYNLK